ncbi:cytochrome P450 [Nocardia sp. N2S4-5]|uniref:cytochrome P450 n=1 Tax=Nocardia sp. N2S4-5 TaxID=3351565 RepID=UPI0037D45AA0
MTSPLSMASEPRWDLNTPKFAADPHEAYRAMRERHGPLVPVWLAPGVPATLVIGYRHAVQILADDEHFPADPRVWQRGVPEGCPVKPLLEHRDNALRNAGEEHRRYRTSVVAALDSVDRFAVEKAVDRAAEELINRFCGAGEAELVGGYALPLSFGVMCELLGLPDVAARKAWAEMAAILDGVHGAGERFAAGLYEVVRSKRATLGEDMMSRLITHPAGLTDEEVVAQTALLLGPGTEPMANLITNAVRLVLVDDRFAGGVLGGALELGDAIDTVLFEDTPLPNFCMKYPRHPILIEGVWLPAHQPVVISMAACNNDPAVTAGDRWGNRSHLSWGGGDHQCPAPAQTIARIAIHRALGQLFDALEIQPVPERPPVWRPGPFHRALAALWVRFPPSAPMNLAMPPQIAR